MALPTIGVLDKDSAPQTVNTANSGRQAANDSQAVVLSTEDKADLAATTASLAALEAALTPTVPVEHAVTGLGHGVTTVTTAGTDVALAGSTVAQYVTIQAQTDNTGIIAVGATGVDATVATGTGVALAAGESITLPCDNLADIFIDATVSGEGVRYTYFT